MKVKNKKCSYTGIEFKYATFNEIDYKLVKEKINIGDKYYSPFMGGLIEYLDEDYGPFDPNLLQSYKAIIMNKYKDKNDIVLKNGDVINIHQTVNGCNIFVVLKVDDELDIRYGYDLTRKYEYDKIDLISNTHELIQEVEFEIINNVYKYLDYE